MASGDRRLSFLACSLLWPCSLIETSDRVKWDSPPELVGFIRPSHKVSENRTFILKVFLLSVCVVMICNVAGRGFQTKTRIWFTLTTTYKIATFIGYLD